LNEGSREKQINCNGNCAEFSVKLTLRKRGVSAHFSKMDWIPLVFQHRANINKLKLQVHPDKRSHERCKAEHEWKELHDVLQNLAHFPEWKQVQDVGQLHFVKNNWQTFQEQQSCLQRGALSASIIVAYLNLELEHAGVLTKFCNDFKTQNAVFGPDQLSSTLASVGTQLAHIKLHPKDNVCIKLIADFIWKGAGVVSDSDNFWQRMLAQKLGVEFADHFVSTWVSPRIEQSETTLSSTSTSLPRKRRASPNPTRRSQRVQSSQIFPEMEPKSHISTVPKKSPKVKATSSEDQWSFLENRQRKDVTLMTCGHLLRSSRANLVKMGSDFIAFMKQHPNQWMSSSYVVNSVGGLKDNKTTSAAVKNWLWHKRNMCPDNLLTCTQTGTLIYKTFDNRYEVRWFDGSVN
jgi:hypothetical protein